MLVVPAAHFALYTSRAIPTYALYFAMAIFKRARGCRQWPEGAEPCRVGQGRAPLRPRGAVRL